jgi:hypothetical protein
MKHFVYYMVTLFVIIFGGIALVNYTFDPAHVYGSKKCIDFTIEGIRKGYNVEGITNLDERLYKLRFAELHKGETFDYLALGSSRILTVSEDILHGASILNLAISSCQIEEIMAYYQMCKDFDIHVSNVLITADPSLFNGHIIDGKWESKSLGYYYNEYMGNSVTEQSNDWDLVWNLFSVPYFKVALLSGMTPNDTLTYVKTAINKGATYRTDGSYYWSESVREAPQSVIDEKARTGHFELYEDFSDISEERIDLFNKLMEGLKTDSINVYLVRSPFHPVFYKKLLKKKGAIAAFNYIDNYAKKNHIPLIGSFNPADEGLNSSDFYDGPHVRKEFLDKIVERELFQ